MAPPQGRRVWIVAGGVLLAVVLALPGNSPGLTAIGGGLQGEALPSAVGTLRAPPWMPATGNWYVNSSLVLENQSYQLSGDLFIGNGGNLTLRDVNITFDVQYEGEFGIGVLAGGGFQAYHSTFAPLNPSLSITFADDGGLFVLSQSNLSEVGSCPAGGCSPNSGSFPPTEGLTISSPGAIIDNTTFYNPGVAAADLGGNAWFENDTIVNDSGGGFALLDSPSPDHVAFDRFLLRDPCPYGCDQIVAVGGGNNSISDDAVNLSGPVLSAGTSGGVGGIVLQGSSGNVMVSDHLESGTFPFEATYGSSNNLIADSTLEGVGGGVQIVIIQSSADNYFVEDAFQGNNTGADGGNGILAVNAPNTTIAQSTFTGLGQPVLLSHASGSDLVNDNISAPVCFPLLVEFASDNGSFLGNNESAAGPPLCGGSGTGLLVSDSSGSLVHDNSLASSMAIATLDSSNNTMVGNDFWDEGDPSHDAGGNNTWNTSTGGNYWSDHTGSGPYFLGPDGIDDRPLPSPLTILPWALPTRRYAPLPTSPGGPPTNLVFTGTVVENHVSWSYPSGSIDVEPGARLTINGSTLDLGNFGMNIDAGGFLNISNSTLVGASVGFSIMGTGTVVLRNSTATIEAGGLSGGAYSTLLVVGTTLHVGAVGTFTVRFWNMTLLGSRVLGAPNGYGFAFRNFGGGPSGLEVQGSDLENGSGWQDSIYTVTFGGPGNVSVNDSTMDGCVGALFLVGSNTAPLDVVRVTNDTFRGDLSTMIVTAYDLVNVSDDIFWDDFEGTTAGAALTIFDSNVVSEGIQGDLTAGIASWMAVPWTTQGGAVRGNLIESVYGGGVQAFGSNLTASWNEVDTGPHGLFTVSGSNDLLVDNTVTGGDGLALQGSGGWITHNVVTNTTGLSTGSGTGITVQGNNDVTVGNTATNWSVGVNVIGGDDVTYHDNFENYTVNAWGGGSGDLWDLRGEGSYWSGYAGSDLNLSGIGDTPYTLSNGERDTDPYLLPNGWERQISVQVTAGLPSVGFEIDGVPFLTGANGSTQVSLESTGAYGFSWPSTDPVSPGTEWAFGHWFDGSTSPNRTVSLTGNSSLEVAYDWKSLLSVEGSNVNTTGGGWFANRSTTTITAGTGPGFHFSHWVVDSPSGSSLLDPNAPTTTVTVQGPTTVTAVVLAVTYGVNFTEEGLASGTSWGVTVGSDLETTSAPTLALALKNGSYPFEVSYVPGYVGSPSNGSFLVSGAPVGEALTFVQVPLVVSLEGVQIDRTTATVPEGGMEAFSATPSCSGTCPTNVNFTWTLSNRLGSVAPVSGPTTAFTAGASAGQVELTVSATLGAAFRNASATITISGTNVSKSGGFLGLPGVTGYLVVGGIAAAVVLAAVLVLFWRGKRRPDADGATPAVEAKVAVAPGTGEASETGDSARTEQRDTDRAHQAGTVHPCNSVLTPSVKARYVGIGSRLKWSSKFLRAAL